MNALKTLAVLGLSLVTCAAISQGQPPQAAPTPQQRIAMLKQWLQASQAQLRTYEWVETTVISKDGEEKHRTEKRCYYGVDGTLQKVLVSDANTGGEGGPPGILLPGKLIKKAGKRKAEDLKEYMQSAGELVQSYLPPDSSRIQQSVDAGKMTLAPLDGGRRVQLVFKDYMKAGDSLSVDIENPTNRLMGMQVSSYVEDPEETVVLNAGMSVLPDGTIYTARTTLTAESKGVEVVIMNTGYHRSGGG